ncbi:unnamed protein product [Rhizophagus irregularis]|nr:unnamed protein product [Rhizophagus irregularis]CAB4438725.1 unnamed protein product [Rhizophagus irregularis]
MWGTYIFIMISAIVRFSQINPLSIVYILCKGGTERSQLYILLLLRSHFIYPPIIEKENPEKATIIVDVI